MLTNLRYINEKGWIVGDYVSDSGTLVIEPGQPVYDAAMRGDFGAIAPYTPPPPPPMTDAEKARAARLHRDRLLYACDWTQLADSPVSAVDWRVYRQALRDVPQQDGFPSAIVWPDAPQ